MPAMPRISDASLNLTDGGNTTTDQWWFEANALDLRLDLIDARAQLSALEKAEADLLQERDMLLKERDNLLEAAKTAVSALERACAVIEDMGGLGQGEPYFNLALDTRKAIGFPHEPLPETRKPGR